MNAFIPALLCIGLLSACQREEPTATDETPKAVPPAPTSSLVLFGNGYPTDGAPCRRVGESEATSQWLDHTADLVGCPDAASASALGGKVVATIEGMTVVSVPHGSPAATQAADGTSGPKP
ncbi:hypothetical protein [Stenotrophomonas sp.]|uniref:hypothetical protein n=1 Tax=Stenotrophomonas sp. TaxID=69392 RepID=UPI0028B050B0|nr:hypothetical protein [Stenotrophomonas sp.]